MSELPAVTEKVEFKPSIEQEEWLDTAIQLMTDSPTKISEASNTNKMRWYRWIKNDPGFEDWFYDEYKRLRKRMLPKLDEIGMKYAMQGNHDFWRDMNRKAGEDLDPRSGTNVQVNNNIHFSREKSEFEE